MAQQLTYKMYIYCIGFYGVLFVVILQLAKDCVAFSSIFSAIKTKETRRHELVSIANLCS